VSNRNEYRKHKNNVEVVVNDNTKTQPHLISGAQPLFTPTRLIIGNWPQVTGYVSLLTNYYLLTVSLVGLACVFLYRFLTDPLKSTSLENLHEAIH
jgi:hypothetical protein